MTIRATVQSSDGIGPITGDGVPARSRRISMAAAKAACAACGVTDAQISITWMNDIEIASLNSEYLQHDGPTDVISFPLYEEGETPVGDVYIGYEQAELQAVAHGCPLTEELVRLAVHGTLHVLGFDHPVDEDRTESAMWMLQEAVVSEMFA